MFNYMDANNIPINDKNVSQVKVATYKLQGGDKQFKEFVACSNCAGILHSPVHVITGRVNA
ncbi:MAG: hypothetical protein GY787_29915 [Alteromonadales bacterium]|nr:hypothetical protein [Alteromonadales bacterium]